MNTAVLILGTNFSNRTVDTVHTQLYPVVSSDRTVVLNLVGRCFPALLVLPGASLKFFPTRQYGGRARVLNFV
jgi:hypothetical protein